jgi:RimJ/RimL family protein N-acetyltransferase
VTPWRLGGRGVLHRVSVEDTIRLRRAGTIDMLRLGLAGGDSEAQRWLGWDRASLFPAELQVRLRRKVRGENPGSLHTDESGATFLAALIGTDYIGGASLADAPCDGLSGVGDPGALAIGVVIVPELRGRGLGSRLFALATTFAHDNLGTEQVVAGCEVGNEASRRALLNAGYVPMAGPSEHKLPDGRVIPSLWFVHSA